MNITESNNLMTSLKFTQEVFIELIDSFTNVKMVEPVSICVVALIGVSCTVVGFFTRYFYEKATEEPQIIKEENKMNNVIVANIKEAVQVEDHSFLILGVYLIVGLLVLIIAGLTAQYFARRIKKRTLRRVLTGNEIQNVPAARNV